MSENGSAIADDCSCRKIERLVSYSMKIGETIIWSPVGIWIHYRFFILCRVVEPKENFGKAESPSKRDIMGFDQISESAKYLKEKIRLRPKIGVICGTGLGK